MLDGLLLWTSVLATSGACASAIYTISARFAVADSASLIVLGLGLLGAAHVVQKKSRDAKQVEIS